MPIVGNSKFSHTLPLKIFERLQELLERMQSKIGTEAVLLTADTLASGAIKLEAQAPKFTVLISKQFSALLLARQADSTAGDDANLRLYQVELRFEPEAIAFFLTELISTLENQTVIRDTLTTAQACLQPNQPLIQSEFTLLLIEILTKNLSPDSEVTIPTDTITVCQPLVAEALHQQVEQERLLHQVTTQIRQSLELPVILKTAVKQVRDFLKVDRLVIYQFDFDYTASPTPNHLDSSLNTELLNLPKTAISKNISAESLPLSTEVGWGCVTYEAKSSETISSVLNLTEGNGLTHVPNCRKKYRKGLTFAIDDIETAYPNSPCLLEFLRKIGVRAKLVAPLVVKNKLWGLLIAQQCFDTYHWQDSEKIFLKQIAEHLTVAIYQAQLYSQLQQQKNTLEERVIERTQALRDTLHAAQAANRAKSEFLAAMSHELRTPLTCVIGMSATLLRWSFGQDGVKSIPIHKQRSYLQTIQESGEHLLELINDILDLSQVEAGKAILNITEFSLSKLARQTLRTLKEKAFHQKVNLEMDFQVELDGDRFFADQRRVRQILFNLLGNALKFTPAGGIVTLRVWREHNSVVFQIKDTGIGIAKEQIPLLFQKFQQLETSYHRTYEGTGLGLALTKQLVELHGGRITVESVVAQGSLFTVWLPNHPTTTEESIKATLTPSYLSIPNGIIVLVEDQEETATSICEILTAGGYQIIWLIDASTAVAQIALLQPKAVILGWQLAGMDGFEMMQCLRNSPETQRIKVLALTNPSLPENQEQSLSRVVDDYLYKPIEPLQLLHKVIAMMSD
jgi:two-component system, sensor histidine kinase and response regulator